MSLYVCGTDVLIMGIHKLNTTPLDTNIQFQTNLMHSSGWKSHVPLDNFRIVLFTHQTAVHQAEPISRYQRTMTRDTREAFEVVHIGLRAHHKFIRRDVLTTSHAGAARTK